MNKEEVLESKLDTSDEEINEIDDNNNEEVKDENEETSTRFKDLTNFNFSKNDIPGIMEKINELQSLSNFSSLNLKSKLKQEILNINTNLKINVSNNENSTQNVKVQLVDKDPAKINLKNLLQSINISQKEDHKSEMIIISNYPEKKEISNYPKPEDSPDTETIIFQTDMPLAESLPFTKNADFSKASMAVREIKLGETLEAEILDIIKLWKYILNLILNIKEDFEVSCRLTKKLSRETFNHHTEDLPDWLREIIGGWYEELELTLCDKDNQVIGSSLT